MTRRRHFVADAGSAPARRVILPRVGAPSGSRRRRPRHPRRHRAVATRFGQPSLQRRVASTRRPWRPQHAYRSAPSPSVAAHPADRCAKRRRDPAAIRRARARPPTVSKRRHHPVARHTVVRTIVDEKLPCAVVTTVECALARAPLRVIKCDFIDRQRAIARESRFLERSLLRAAVELPEAERDGQSERVRRPAAVILDTGTKACHAILTATECLG